MKMNDHALKLLRDLSDAPGASGFEDEVVKVARQYAASIGEMQEDFLRNDGNMRFKIQNLLAPLVTEACHDAADDYDNRNAKHHANDRYTSNHRSDGSLRLYVFQCYEQRKVQDC